MTERDAFGPRLRSERERKGIALESISESTKIQLPLLAALERNDLSHWPVGIFRRAFLREYAAAIGLPGEPLVHECLRLFPESGDGQAATPAMAGSDPGSLRLMLEPESRWKMAVSFRRLLAAIADTVVVLGVARLTSAVTGANLWIASGVIGLSYYALATIFVGRGPASWCLARGRYRLASARTRSGDRLASDGRDRLRIVVSRRSRSAAQRVIEDDTLQPDVPQARAQSH